LSLSDRLLVTVLHHRWKTQRRALTVLLGSPRAAPGDPIAEQTPVPEVPAPPPRWKTQRRALPVLLGSPRAATGDAIAEMTPVLEALGRRITPAPITAPTASDLASLIGKTDIKGTSN